MINNIGDIPVIKLFMYNDNYYLYDTYTNRLFHVSKKHFLELNKLCEIGLKRYRDLDLTTCEYKDIMFLHNKGLLQPPFIEKIEHPETRFLPSILSRCINDMTLQVTQDCNFKCRYCLYASESNVERTHQKKHMSWGTAKQAIDFLYFHSIDAKEIHISFYGGEPLLNFPLIKKTICYAEELFHLKQIKYYMTINGSLLTEDVINFISKYNFSLTISLDGSERIQNQNRKFLDNGNNTFKIVYQKIVYLKENYKDFFENFVSFNPVMLDNSDYNEIVEFFNKLDIPLEKVFIRNANLNGIDYLTTRDNNIMVHSNLESNIIEESANKILESVFNDKNHISSVCHHGGPCIPALKYIFVDINGIFYPCEKIIENNAFSIGNLIDGIDIQKVNNFINIGKITEKNCKECWAFRFCDICVSHCIDIEKNQIDAAIKELSCSNQKDKALAFLKKYINKQESVK